MTRSYKGWGRTNYIAWTDMEKVNLIALIYDMQVSPAPDNSMYCALLCNDPSGEPLNTYRDGPIASDTDVAGLIAIFGEDVNAHSERIDLPPLTDVLAPFIPDGDVLIFQHIGSEILRDMTAYAIAINNKGEARTVSLWDINELAKELETTSSK